MAFFTVMIPPPGSGGPREEIERARLLPESFTWGAFIFTGLWLLFNRLWLASLVFAGLWGALFWGGPRLGLGGGSIALAQFALGLFLGLEGQHLIARKLARQGWRLADVVEAPDLPAAERRFFERALAGEGAPRPAAPEPFSSRSTSGIPVIGLFPEASRR